MMSEILSVLKMIVKIINFGDLGQPAPAPLPARQPARAVRTSPQWFRPDPSPGGDGSGVVIERQEGWSASDFFRDLRAFPRIRVVLRTGPSVFEAICVPSDFGFQAGYLNAMTPEYHWHIDASRFGFVRSWDEVHARSDRRVLFFSLHEHQEAEAFLRIYIYRPPRQPFGEEIEDAFMRMHRAFEMGQKLLPHGPTTED